MAHELKHAETEAILPENVHLADDGLMLVSLGEAALARDTARMSEAMRRHAAIRRLTRRIGLKKPD